MPTFELSYEFRGKTTKRDVEAETEQAALSLSGVSNPTLRAIPVDRNPVSRYLSTGDGQKFVELLRKFEHNLYAKVRNREKFFERYEKTTGYKLSDSTPGILISKQEDKWGDELLISFDLSDYEPNFPADAKPRVYDGGKGILNDNDYVWTLIERHGFRFGKKI